MIRFYGGFGSESANDPIRPELQQMAHPTDLCIRAHLHTFLAVLQCFAVKENVT